VLPRHCYGASGPAAAYGHGGHRAGEFFLGLLDEGQRIGERFEACVRALCGSSRAAVQAAMRAASIVSFLARRRCSLAKTFDLQRLEQHDGQAGGAQMRDHAAFVAAGGFDADAIDAELGQFVRQPPPGLAAERPKLVSYRGRFDGSTRCQPRSRKTCPVHFDNNKHSVNTSAVGRPVEVHAYAGRLVIRQDGRVVAEHPRSFGRGEAIYDPWHYVPVLARKLGALRNGAAIQGLGAAAGAGAAAARCARPPATAGRVGPCRSSPAAR